MSNYYLCLGKVSSIYKALYRFGLVTTMDNINYNTSQELRETNQQNECDNQLYEQLDLAAIKRPFHEPPSAVETNKQKSILINISPALFQVVSQCLMLLLLVTVIIIVGYLLHITSSHNATINRQVEQILTNSSHSKTMNKKLDNIADILSNTTVPTSGVLDDILIAVKELLLMHNLSFDALPTSCERIKKQKPNSTSGYYNTTNGTTIYCNMDTLCGSGGGWTRLAYLNMSDNAQNCPSGFRQYESGGVRACGRPNTTRGNCVSVKFPSNGISYSHVCGRVVGYQWGGTEALRQGHFGIDSFYLDGVSITRGCSRQHIWTLLAGYSENFHKTYNCPCSIGSTQNIPSFIGNHYFCESGNNRSTVQHVFYTSDPLWDGQHCSPNEVNCCSVPGLPWFHRDLGNTSTTDHLELRVCGNWNTAKENTPISFYEIFVK